jgi:protein involved in polysaccharide export with SLBB domain
MMNFMSGARSAVLAGALLVGSGSVHAVETAGQRAGGGSERSTGVPLAEPQRIRGSNPSEIGDAGPEERYELASGDRLKIIFFQNADLSGEFRIQADGNVSVPLLGSFSAAGKTTSEIALEVAAAFQRGDKQAAQVVVEVTEWRPVYVTGHVSKPGGYVFTPGMTVLHALSTAGGMYRVFDGSVGTSIGVSSMLGQVQGDTERLKLALARIAGLAAERLNRDLADMPSRLMELCGKTDAEALLAVENRTLKWRRDNLKDRIQSRAKQIALSLDELTAFRGQLVQIKEQKRLKGLQLEDAQSLAEKGLSRRTDLINLQSSIADLERSEREALGAIARAERTLTQVDQEAKELPVLRKLELEREIHELQQQIASYESTISASRDLVGRIAGTEQADRAEQIKYAIMRKTGQNQVFIPGKETTLLHAGDVVVVSVEENRASALRSDPALKGGADIGSTGALADRGAERTPPRQ